MGADTRLILASSSPRRRALLPLLGLEFDVISPGVRERSEGDPRELVLANAERKARAVADARRLGEGELVVGCDTEVVLDGAVLGKPDSEAEARERLRALAGREHEVLSGLVVLGREGIEAERERTVVAFRRLEPREIDAYVASGEWRGRAGGYAVQGLGSSLVREVRGDLSNVIGLPLPLLARLIDRWQAGSHSVS